MAEIIKFPYTVGEYRLLANECIDNEDLLKAIVYMNSALRICKTPSQVRNTKLDLARLYALKLKFSYSNQMLFDVLASDLDNKEAKMLLMFNYLSMNDKDAARYYYDAAKDYIEKRRITNKHELMKMFESEFGEEAVEQNEMMGVFDVDLDKILSSERGPSTYTMIDEKYRFNQKMEEVCQAVKDENYSEAIDLANSALKYDVPPEKKGLAYYSKGLCLLNMGYPKETKQIALESLANEPNNVEMQLLLCEAAEQLDDQDTLDATLKKLLTIDPTEFQQFRRIMQILIDNKKYDLALKFLHERMNDYPDSYSHNEYLGIVYFNSGDIKRAKGIFAKMYNTYGDLCSAKHYLAYIASGNTKPIKPNSIFGDWTELNFQYVSYLYSFLVLNGEELLNKMLKESDELFSAIKWLSQGCRAKPLFDIITEICCAIPTTKEEDRKLKALQKKLAGLLCSYNYVDIIVRMHLAFEVAYSGIEENIPVVANDRFYIANISYQPEASNIGQKAIESYYMACGIAMVRSEEDFKTVSRIATKIHNISNNEGFRWRSAAAIVAVIIEVALGLPIAEVAPHIKFSEDTKTRYLNQLLSVTTLDCLRKNI